MRLQRQTVVPALVLAGALALVSCGVLSPSGRSTWSRTNLPSPPSASGSLLWSAVACSTARACLVGGTDNNNNNQVSVLEATTNAGRTWTDRSDLLPASMDGGIQSASCERQNCLFIAENQTVTTTTIGRSEDAGRTWAVVPNPPSWAANSISAELVGCSASTCLVYGDNALSGLPPSGPADQYHDLVETANGGRTWTAIPVPGSIAVDQIACIWSGQCWVLYEMPYSPLEEVATTLDAGSVWTKVGSLTLDPDHLVGFACEDVRTCFILDDSNSLTESHDGGRTWHASQPPTDASGSTELGTDAMTCTPRSTCWIVSSETGSLWIGPSEGSGDALRSSGKLTSGASPDRIGPPLG